MFQLSLYVVIRNHINLSNQISRHMVFFNKGDIFLFTLFVAHALPQSRDITLSYTNKCHFETNTEEIK